MNAEKLPGMGAVRRRRGRAERSVDAVSSWLRSIDQLGPLEAAIITSARVTARAMDDLEHDPDAAPYTVGSVARVHLEHLRELRPVMVTSDTLDELLAELADDAA